MKDDLQMANGKAKEKGITLIALIISIIVLVILAAVSVAAIYNSKIVNYAIEGGINYAEEQVKEEFQMIMSEWPIKKASNITLEQFLSEKERKRI